MPTPILRALLVATTCAASSLLAQDADLQDPGDPRLTVMAGLGNTFAGLGGTVEYRFSRETSVVGGLGVGLANGVDAAGGLRLFTPGVRHRAFLEAVFAPMAVSTGPFDDKVYYGPGLSAGYGYTSGGGFSALIGIGAGWATTVETVELVVNVGLGYTWRR
jgi:opacity protein-like surface antigen